jgi:SAM-dependent methyltransferase
MRDVWRTYEHCYREYDQERSRSLMERPYLEELTARLESHTVLDLGCGMGEPIAKYFIDAGCKVTGVDASSVMIGLCRERYPEAEWIVEDMRRLSLAREFGAVIAWDSFFHLAQDEQRAMFSIFASHVQPRGLLLFTSGPRAGVAVGQFHGWPLFHSSLDPSEYRELLRNSGFVLLQYRPEDPNSGGHTVWLAKRG